MSFLDVSSKMFENIDSREHRRQNSLRHVSRVFHTMVFRSFYFRTPSNLITLFFCDDCGRFREGETFEASCGYFRGIRSQEVCGV
jgi:hypothetical protein